MMKTSTNTDFPLTVEISFQKLVEYYHSHLDGGNEMYAARAQQIFDIVEKYPKLVNGLKTQREVDAHEDQMKLLFEDLFPTVLTSNEIKIATVPYRDIIFKSTKRFRDIIKEPSGSTNMVLAGFDDRLNYIMGCSMILMFHYGYKVDFRRPTYYSVRDANDIMRYYRVLYNADFTEIIKTDKAVDITQEDVDELLENFDNIDLWKEKFPPQSYIFKGFVIATLFDLTLDVSISNFKTELLKNDTLDTNRTEDSQGIFRSIFGLPNLKIGVTDYNAEEGIFEMIPGKELPSYILNGKTSVKCVDALCDVSYYTLFKQNEIYVVTNTAKYAELYPDNRLYKKFRDQGVASFILIAVVHHNKVLAVLELTSNEVNALNTINAVKLKDIMPFMVESVVRSKQLAENAIELLIQNECTSIHPSVHWKFKKEAKRVITQQANGQQAVFKEIVFEDVYPLFGQIDIKGSSEARNVATQQDLLLQLKHISEIIDKIYAIEELPIYEQLKYRVNDYISDLKETLKVNSERQVLNFVKSEISPLFKHLSKKSDILKSLIAEYYELVEDNTGLVYHHRKDYDESVMSINKRLASILDKKQVDAQAMYPHYFERFKTDGIEHNLYIGESITKLNSFNKIYLYNLRLWQLQVMCEMENAYYRMKSTLPIPLDVASMILAFNSSLSLRFRMDEKRFDVDGTYNARYEVIKKRVDKAHIKGTNERITQAGKIAIVYSQGDDEKEYLKYIGFLQSKKYLDKDEEIVKLEDLQGVTGLKAIRVSVLYSKGKSNAKEYYTYEDLMEQLES